MRNSRFFSLPVLLLILTISSYAAAQERKTLEEQHGDVLSVAEKRRPRLWDASVEGARLPGSDMRGGGGEVSIAEARAGIGRRFTVNSRLELAGGVRYSLQQIDAPAAARLPQSLHALSVSLGGEYRTSDRLTLGIRVSPGLSSDLQAVTEEDLRIPVSFSARFRKSQSLTLLGGIIYTGGSHSYPFLPMAGVLYAPSETWVFSAGFPRTGVLYRPGRDVEWHLGVESGRGEYRLHDDTVQAGIISYRDIRGIVGAELPLIRAVRIALSAGYSFARRFHFYESSRDDLRLDSVPFARVQIKTGW